MDWTTFDALTSFDLWHQRLGHVLHRKIEQTILHAIGLEILLGKNCKRNNKCASCMLGTCTFENYPGLMEQAPQPLGRVHVDMYSPSVTSIERYNHALIYWLTWWMTSAWVWASESGRPQAGGSAMCTSESSRRVCSRCHVDSLSAVESL